MPEKNCFAHPTFVASQWCADCGRGLCARCVVETGSGVRCAECAPRAPKKKSNTLLIVLIVAGILVLGGFCTCGVFATLLMPALMKAKSRALEVRVANAVNSLKMAESIYEDDHQRFGTLKELLDAKVIDAGTVAVDGYVFEAAPGTNDPAKLYWIVARPTEPGGGQRVFYTNQKGGIDAFRTPSDGSPVPMPDPATADVPAVAVPFAQAR